MKNKKTVLTDSQEIILAGFIEFKRMNKREPNCAELADRLGYASSEWVRTLCHQLVKKGKLRFNPRLLTAKFSLRYK